MEAESTQYRPDIRSRVCIFNHIPKCGGTTMTGILEKALGGQQLVYHEGDMSRIAKRVNAIGAAQNHFITGHFVWGIHEALTFPHTLTYVTMLREPVSLFKSYYNYYIKKYNLPCSMEQFLLTQYEANPLCMHLANGDLELAKRRLLHDYAAVGILERYGESLELFARELGFTLTEYDVQNVSRSTAVELPPDIEAYFRRKNRKDIELYAWALKLFQERAAPRAAGAAEPKAVCRPRLVNSVPYNKDIAQLLVRGDYKGALDAFERTGILETLDGMTVLSLCYAAGDMARYDKAGREQRRRNMISGFNVAIVCHNRDKQLGRRIIEAEVRRNRPLKTRTPDSFINRYLTTCLTVLAEMRASNRRPQEALELYGEAMALGAPSPRMLTSHAQFLMNTGDHEGAVRVLRLIQAANVNASWISTKMHMLSRCWEALGSPTRAAAYGESSRLVLEARPRPGARVRRAADAPAQLPEQMENCA